MWRRACGGFLCWVVHDSGTGVLWMVLRGLLWCKNRYTVFYYFICDNYCLGNFVVFFIFIFLFLIQFFFLKEKKEKGLALLMVRCSCYLLYGRDCCTGKIK